LDGSHTKGRPSRPSKSNPPVTARFIHENIVIRTEIRRIMQVQVSEISIPCLCYTANCFLVQPREASALPMLEVVTCTSNSSRRKSTISY
jgi:hypothetical protein